ncbi:hypothetical protein WJX72_003972 [[Myrmecia] bisecta]|uniref:Uncharacterized protein n=1 Tax=[Myrmecia] bisecta TaxID=41462 RepID=A0AAW1Q3P5_9CHLO
MAGIGMMDGAYFVGRNEILQWLNQTLDLNLSKIEQTASGAIACQLLDALHPGAVALNKVDFNAKNDYEYIANYKVLQAGFSKLQIDKHIEVNKLVKARPLDNIEFMQWFKSYWDSHTGGGQPIDYDAVGRRAASKTGDMKGASRPASSQPKRASSSGQPAAAKPGATSARGAPASTLARQTSGAAQAAAKEAARAVHRTHSQGSEDGAAMQSSAAAQSQVTELTGQVTELKLKVDTVERERDFYFDKLRDIEILCQSPELQSIPIVKVFEKILYAADEKEAKEAMMQAQRQYGTAQNGA